jgi:hypothetical protein
MRQVAKRNEIERDWERGETERPIERKRRE